jgi:multiple sugar transport system ATP-binding protein
VGRAIVREPKAFLFDEPLSNLDARLRLSTRAELKALHQRLKTTTVYVTHDQEEAMTLGDRIVVMSKGVVQQVGPPLEVYRRPANRFVAGFVGSPPMNFMPGRIASEGGVAFVEDPAAGGERLRLPLPVERTAGLPAHSQVVLGFRAQALREHGPGTVIQLDVRIVEPLGDVVDLHGSTPAGSPVVARIAPTMAIRPGMRAALHLDPAGIHLFEPGEFGRAF